MSEQPQSLQALFSSARAQKENLENDSAGANPDFEQKVNELVGSFEKCQALVSRISLFSPNESLDDIATGDLRYLTLDYLLAEVLQRTSGPDRLRTLRRIRAEYENFFERLNNYDLLSTEDKKLYERYSEDPDSFTLAPTNDAATRRQVKVSRFREEKELKQKLEYLSNNSHRVQDNDDDVVRQLYLAEISLYTHQTFQALDLLSQELTMLAAAESIPQDQNWQQENDNRSRDNNDESGYSERLDAGLASLGRGGRPSGPLLNKKGKPMQPFVLTDRRRELQKGVFGPGHNLPTMSIDEYLEEEKRRGGMVEGGGEQSGIPPEIDEDDMDKADEETMKARAWDEFTEANPRGSGNTLNRG